MILRGRDGEKLISPKPKPSTVKRLFSKVAELRKFGFAPEVVSTSERKGG